MTPPRRNDAQIASFFDVASDKGAAMWGRMRSFSVPMTTAKTLDTCGYLIDEGILRPNATATARMMLASAGLTIGTLQYIDVRSVGTSSWDNAAYSNWFDVEHGIIICNENDKTADTHTAEMSLFPSEVLWQCYQRAVVTWGDRLHRPVPELRAIVRLNVVNKDTQDVIFEAATISTSIRKEANGHVEYNFLDPGFYAILGTPNGASTVRMMVDHKVELRNRLIDKIVIVGDEALRLVEAETRTMVMFLDRERLTPVPSPTADGSPSKKQKTA